MKNNFKFYVIVWTTLLVVFNVIVFVTPNSAGELNKFGGSFWVGYVFVLLAFVAHFACAWFSLRDSKEIIFLKLPMISISVISLIVMSVVGILCMVIPNMPIWLGIIVCVLSVGFCVVAMTAGQALASNISDIDKKIKVKTFFIKSLTLDVEMLMEKSQSADVKKIVNKVYEAVRYSDPMSDDMLAGIESQITLKYAELADVVDKNEADSVNKIANEILLLVNERNKKCKLLK